MKRLGRMLDEAIHELSELEAEQTDAFPTHPR
jgi:hypothetical protein